MAEFVGLSVSLIVSTMSEQRMAVYDLLNVLKMYDGTIGHDALFNVCSKADESHGMSLQTANLQIPLRHEMTNKMSIMNY